MLSSPQLRQLLDYDPATGVFLWKPRANVTRTEKSWNARFAGKVAGRTNAIGYREIAIFGKLYKASRLAWLYMTGEWPADMIDHQDRNRANDSFSNLREATPAQNSQNAKPRSNKTGFQGVFLHKPSGRFTSQIQVARQRISLGYFDTPELAHQAYVEALSIHHGEFAYPS